MEPFFAALHSPPTPLKILIIDDEPSIRQTLCQALAIDGHKIYEAEDGVMGVRLFTIARPDLVLLDMILPKRDGLQALQDIRRVDSKVGVIIMSALTPDRLTIRSTLSTADSYLQKPFSMKLLYMHVQLVMKKARLRYPKPAWQELVTNGFHRGHDKASLQK
jgi:DNA-binding response OmpR family regulator